MIDRAKYVEKTELHNRYNRYLKCSMLNIANRDTVLSDQYFLKEVYSIEINLKLQIALIYWIKCLLSMLRLKQNFEMY